MGAESSPAQNPPLPVSHKTQNFPCFREGYRPKPCPEVPPVLLFPSASHRNRFPSSLECALLGFRVAILSQQLSPSGSGVYYSQPPCTGSGKHVLCYTGSWWSPERHMSQESSFSVCPSEKQKCSTLHSWSQFSSKHVSRIWVTRQVPAPPSALLSSPGRLPLSLQTWWLPLWLSDLLIDLLSHSRPRSSSIFSFSLPQF